MEHISHDHYCDRSVHPEVIEYIETHLDSTPRQLYQDIRAHPELKDLSTQTTQKQVWFWWGERSASSWRLCDESIINALGPAMLRPTDGPAAAKLAIEEFVIQHPNVGTGIVSSHMVGQTVSSEGGIRGIALYAFGIIAALRGQVVEVSLDATFGTNSSGHDLFAVMAELNGTGAPLMYFLLDTKDMKGDVRRIEMLVHVLGMLKGMGIAPRFVGAPTQTDPNARNRKWDQPGGLEMTKEENEDMVNFVSRHFNMHPLIPLPAGVTLTSEQLRVKAATETYQHCKSKGWARVWAYL
ncbi:unnamed protein product [Tilletia controversa]|nr:unnamed protein product [Tilletia controversa]